MEGNGLPGSCAALSLPSSLMADDSSPTDSKKDLGGVTTDLQGVKDESPAILGNSDDSLLAELGYKAVFKREFSLFETVAFAFSIMGVIASVTSTFSFPLVSGGHVGMVFGWLIPCLFVMPIAACMAELASSMPTSAGLYYFAAKLAPDRFAPLASWITGWANITGQVTLVCGIDFTCAQMITTAVQVASDGNTIVSAGATYGILLAILFLHGLVSSSATWVLARLNLYYVILTTFVASGTTIGVIISLLVVSGQNGTRVSTQDAFTLFENNTGWTSNAWAFILAFTSPMWTLTGYDSAAHISEETAGAARAAPMAILLSVGGTATFGWLIYIAASFATSSVSDLLTTTLPLPFGQLLLDTLGKPAMIAVFSLIIVVQFVTGAAQAVDASRVVYAFSRDNALPGSRYWKIMNSYTQTPVNAAWLVISCSAVCGLVGFSNAALSSLAGSSVIGLYLSYVTPIFLRITSGRSKFVPGPFHLGALTIPLGIIACSWVVFVIVFLMFPGGIGPTPQTMNYSVVIIMFVVLGSGLWWVVRARKWFTGPVRTIEREIYEKTHRYHQVA